MIEISTLQQHVIDFLDQTEEARTLSERDRDYYNNRQWTPAQIAIMEARHQAPVVDNRIKPKVEGLKGLLVQRRTDPKGYARTQAHEEASEAVTDALRYVSDNVEFDSIELDCFDNLIVEGYGGCIIDTRQTRRGPEIKIDLIPWDRIYFDPHSRRPDFKDAQYMGIVLWMDVDVAIQTFPKKKTEIEAAANNNHYSDETFEDRPFLGRFA